MAIFFQLVCVSAVFLATASASTQDRRSYFKPGGELELRPVPGVATISSVSWKKGSFVAADFVKDALPVTYYGEYRDRTELDTGTGRLRIRSATAADAGDYILELNGAIQPEPYKAIIPAEVPEPEVRFYPVSCDHNNRNCTAGCEGNVSKAGHVTYSWILGDGDWEERGQTLLLLNNATIQAVEHLSCRIENLLGSKGSKTATNPLHKHHDIGQIVGIIIGVLMAAGLAGGGGYFLYKKKGAIFSPDVNGPAKPGEDLPLNSQGESPGPPNGEPAADAADASAPPEKVPPGVDTPAST